MARRYRRRRRGDGGIDDWLMTYADMITLLLCFFAIFLSVSVPKKEEFSKARQKLLEQFASPSVFEAASFPEEETPYDSMPSIVDQYHEGETPVEAQDLYFGEVASEDNAEQAQATSQGRGQGQEKNVGRGERSGGSDKEGDRIKTLEMPSAAFFASGSAELSEDGKKLLREVLEKNIRTEDLKDYQITIEGHTDDVPIRTLQFPSNWELSTARAAAVVRFFIEQGVNPQRLRASGYADVIPKVPNRDANGVPIPANQAQNRRVIIKLEKIEKDQ